MSTVQRLEGELQEMKMIINTERNKHKQIMEQQNLAMNNYKVLAEDAVKREEQKAKECAELKNKCSEMMTKQQKWKKEYDQLTQNHRQTIQQLKTDKDKELKAQKDKITKEFEQHKAKMMKTIRNLQTLTAEKERKIRALQHQNDKMMKEMDEYEDKENLAPFRTFSGSDPKIRIRNSKAIRVYGIPKGYAMEPKLRAWFSKCPSIDSIGQITIAQDKNENHYFAQISFKNEKQASLAMDFCNNTIVQQNSFMYRMKACFGWKEKCQYQYKINEDKDIISEAAMQEFESIPFGLIGKRLFNADCDGMISAKDIVAVCAENNQLKQENKSAEDDKRALDREVGRLVGVEFEEKQYKAKLQQKLSAKRTIIYKLQKEIKELKESAAVAQRAFSASNPNPSAIYGNYTMPIPMPMYQAASVPQAMSYTDSHSNAKEQRLKIRVTSC